MGDGAKNHCLFGAQMKCKPKISGIIPAQALEWTMRKGESTWQCPGGGQPPHTHVLASIPPPTAFSRSPAPPHPCLPPGHQGLSPDEQIGGSCCPLMALQDAHPALLQDVPNGSFPPDPLLEAWKATSPLFCACTKLCQWV